MMHSTTGARHTGTDDVISNLLTGAVLIRRDLVKSLATWQCSLGPARI